MGIKDCVLTKKDQIFFSFTKAIVKMCSLSRVKKSLYFILKIRCSYTKPNDVVDHLKNGHCPSCTCLSDMNPL